MTPAGAFVTSWAVERELDHVAAEHPALWREIRRFNAPVKLALAAVARVLGTLEDPRAARLVALGPCHPGSPEMRRITRELDAGFSRGSCDGLRVNPVLTLHVVDNLALSALAIRLENREPCVCLGGAAGQAWQAIEIALEVLAAGEAREVLVFGGDDCDGAACGAALVLTARAGRARLIGIERAGGGGTASPHAARGLDHWLAALAAAPAGAHRYSVPVEDGDGIDRIDVVAEVA